MNLESPFVSTFKKTTSPQSKLVGRAQGLYELACQHQLAITVSMSFVFVDGPNNGSCISLFGNNWQIVHVRKMPIIGATHVFLLTCGYAIAQTHRADFKSGDVIVGCNVIVVY
ncbi:Dirigent protein 23 [Citrus sinensis]|nr:Dirigent protein 23 [Citrus sinensis]